MHLPRAAAATLALALTLALAPSPARAESLAYNGAVGVGSALCSLLWAPIKVATAVGGTLTSGLVLLFTFDTDLTGGVFRRTVGGDYVVTPAHLEGRQEFHFRG